MLVLLPCTLCQHALLVDTAVQWLPRLHVRHRCIHTCSHRVHGRAATVWGARSSCCGCCPCRCVSCSLQCSPRTALLRAGARFCDPPCPPSVPTVPEAETWSASSLQSAVPPSGSASQSEQRILPGSNSATAVSTVSTSFMHCQSAPSALSVCTERSSAPSAVPQTHLRR